MRSRADTLLVERGFFPSRARAQQAIAAGLVCADGDLVRKASQPLSPDAAIVAAAPHPWASRGGVKLAAALDAFALDPAGLSCLDIGASTGGFTDVLLRRGARAVVCVDVGHGQFEPKLAADPRVTLREGLDARRLTQEIVGVPPQAIVCDVSFISQRLALPVALRLADRSAWLVSLVKPQFEVGRAHLVKGAVKDPLALRSACEAVRGCVEGLGWTSLGLIPSPLPGGDGAREFLYAARHG
jgi:23S rRNA (cytidine1920-2'-O)/16S rRNA (cytidine1409-2'-O)-methyltransferase